MDERPDDDRAPDEAPQSLADISLADRWAPLVRDPDKPFEPSPRLARRTLASAACLIVLALILWAL